MNYDLVLKTFPPSTYIDFDGYYGDQCWDLVAAGLAIQNLPIAWADAHAWWNHPDLVKDFDFFSIGSVKPQRGDIGIWKPTLPGSGGAGHIDFYDHAVEGGFIGLDQNWPTGSAVRFQIHDFSYMYGFMRLKGGDMVASTAHLDAAMKAFFGPDYQVSQDQINAYVGKVDANKLIEQLNENQRHKEFVAEFRDAQNWKNHAVNEFLPQIEELKKQIAAGDNGNAKKILDDMQATINKYK